MGKSRLDYITGFLNALRRMPFEERAIFTMLLFSEDVGRMVTDFGFMKYLNSDNLPDWIRTIDGNKPVDEVRKIAFEDMIATYLTTNEVS